MNDKKETQKAEKDEDKSSEDGTEGKKPSIDAPIDAPDDEKGGYKDAGLPEPTRYNDWEVKGRCSDF